MGKSSKKPSQLEILIELNDELENYFNNTIIPQLFVDADMMLRKYTPAAMKHFKLSASDLGKHISEVSHNIRFPTIIENITEVVETGKDLEKEIQTTDKVWYQMNILPYIIRKENRTNGVIITFVDINDRIQILNGYERLNRNYENIIHSISHDIKGPLSNMEGLISILKETPADVKDNRLIIDMLSESVVNLRKTVEDLADIDYDKEFAKAPERVNFENIIEDAKLALRDKIAESNARIFTKVRESEINFSRKNIRSIVYNLLSNAIKYKKPDCEPVVTISTEKSGEDILLKVSDNGLGIAEDQQHRIFSRYARVHDNVEGTGVGLFIVKGMVEAMGGRIEVKSKEGEGTTFLVYFK
ncbi:two-component system phosphate regulon sensor histidine kinase PhoR [Pontibacter mucosus]|uniref:histidine kinase n=1 Tax=Pontibacter mucosus TaxID=1649266 RepID=A0A2T5YGU4_9BACT|nr:ATP-binding protein [Pontibacter mucosus]PTX18514.1 two-component system phosphate regulon sensor histidine kinase PhoR [Pontibacter mucosus]